MKSPTNKCFLFALLFFSATTLSAQVTGLPGIEESLKKDALENLNPKQFEQIKTIPVDNVVNGKLYRVGPGDVLSLFVSTWGQEATLIVSPENTLHHQHLGELAINGKTLAQVKDTLVQILKKKVPSAQVALSLRQPRSVFISVAGNVIAPSTYTLPASMRVSSVLKLANQLPQNLVLPQDEVARIRRMQEYTNQSKSTEGFLKTASYSARNIVVLHKDGSSSEVDLEKASVEPQSDLDPYVREGDEIFVPAEPPSFPTISISGGVRRPAIVAFKEGDKASFLLKLGFGPKNKNSGEVSLIQPFDRGKLTLHVDSAFNLLGQDFELQPGSTITVEERRENVPQQQGVVTVSGEVKRPGSYVIEPNKTKVKDVIEMAGGFTSEAYLPLAQIRRRESPPLLSSGFRNNIYERFQYSNLTLNDTLRYVLDMSYRKPIVSADFVELFEKNSSRDNVSLQDGDQILVPKNPRRVYVYGQVMKPGYVEYQPGKTMDWYIEQAGGYAENAAQSRSRIIKGNNNMWIEGDETVSVEAGDEIYVPRPPDIPRTDEIQSYSIIVNAIGIAVSVTLAIISFIRYSP